MRKAVREEEQEAEDPDKFLREAEEASDASDKPRRGRGRGRARGKGRGKGRGRGGRRGTGDEHKANEDDENEEPEEKPTKKKKRDQENCDEHAKEDKAHKKRSKDGKNKEHSGKDEPNDDSKEGQQKEKRSPAINLDLATSNEESEEVEVMSSKGTPEKQQGKPTSKSSKVEKPAGKPKKDSRKLADSPFVKKTRENRQRDKAEQEVGKHLQKMAMKDETEKQEQNPPKKKKAKTDPAVRNLDREFKEAEDGVEGGADTEKKHGLSKAKESQPSEESKPEKTPLKVRRAKKRAETAEARLNHYSYLHTPMMILFYGHSIKSYS